MCSKFLALAVGLAVGATISVATAQDARKLTIWNDSDQDIIVVVETPSQKDYSRRTVEVPSRTTVFNIPIPSVDGGQFAIALNAHAADAGLKIADPVTLLGFEKLFPTNSSPRINSRINSTIPVLRYRAYVPSEEGGYGGAAGVAQEESRRLAALSSPVYTDEAQQMVGRAMQNPNRIDYGKIKKKAL